MMKIRTAVATIMCLVFAAVSASARADRPGVEYQPVYREGEVLVKFRSVLDEHGRGQARGLVHTIKVKHYRHAGVEKLSLGPGITAEEAVRQLRSNPGVEYAELNWKVRFLAMPRMEPGDPRYVSGEQWHLDAPPLPGYHVTTTRIVFIDRDIDAPEAWAVMNEVFTTEMSGAVGVIDSGCGELGYFNSAVGYIPNHQDLPNSSLWANTVELATIGGDDGDPNGYIDDVNGYDFWGNDNVMADSYPLDYTHGTFISGIIAAAWDNGVGGAGVGMNSLKVLPLRSTYLDEIIDSIEYAIDTTTGTPPIRVLNASWTFPISFMSLRDAIEAAGTAGIAFVAAASNEGNNNDLGAEAFPAEYTKIPLDNVLAVAASDSTGGLAYFSNYGPVSVQIAAPGQDFLSVSGGTSSYESASGTSFAAPIAASALALIMSANPGLTPAEAIDRLIDGGDFDARLSGLIRSGKRVNLAGALAPFAPYSGYAPMDTRQPISIYADSVSALYGSIISAVSASPSVAVMVTLPGGAWAVSPVSPGLTTFTLEFDGASAPVGTYETGTWRVTGIAPFYAQVNVGHSQTFTSLIPYSTIEWSVTNPAVGTIDSEGVFTAQSEGTTRVILNIDGQDVDNSGVILTVNGDVDADGYYGDVDCDDTDPDVNPGAEEICDDGIDNDCDGDTDTYDSTCYIDGDGDGYNDHVDCDDSDPDVNPGAEEICTDGIDNDCDGDTDTADSHCVDSDGDGYMDDIDCSDTDPDINPGADELCTDGIDNDCDGDVDSQDADCGSGGGGGGGCGTTLPPDNDPWSYPVMMVIIGLVLFGMRRKWLAEVSSEFKVQGSE